MTITAHYAIIISKNDSRACSVCRNLAMLRAQSEPSHTQVEVIKDLTSLLESELASLSPTDTSETGERILA